MNILFLTIGQFESIEAHSIYADLLRCFREHGDDIYVITPYEQKTGKKTKLIHEENAHILHIETGNVTKAANLIQKGLAPGFNRINLHKGNQNVFFKCEI